MSESGRCTTCGGLLPCDSCLQQPTGAAELRLLPCPGEAMIDEEERFTRVLREVKSDVVKRRFVADRQGEGLLGRARRLGRLVEAQDWAKADAVAGKCLDDVLEFPRRERRLVSKVLVLCVAALCSGVALVGILMR